MGGSRGYGVLTLFASNHHFNLTGRSRTDAVVALHIDKPRGDSFEYRALRTPGYTGAAGDGLMTVVGMNGVEVEGEDKVELMVVNMGPSVDPATGVPFPDQSVMGSNSTIEQFEVRGSDAEEMVHVHTWADNGIATPNRMAMVGGSKDFYVTNLQGPHKVGLQSRLGPLLGNGEVAFCSRGKGCRRVSSGHKFPNGLAAHDGLVYVPNSFGKSVQVFRIKEDHDLELVEDVKIDYGIDNVSVDANGDVFVAAMPRAIEIFSAFDDPFNAKPSSAVLRMRRGEDGKLGWEKVLEDQGGTLPATTTAVHDAKTGRFFLSSEFCFFGS